MKLRGKGKVVQHFSYVSGIIAKELRWTTDGERHAMTCFRPDSVRLVPVD